MQHATTLYSKVYSFELNTNTVCIYTVYLYYVASTNSVMLTRLKSHFHVSGENS